jgi:hypothetical protein
MLLMKINSVRFVAVSVFMAYVILAAIIWFAIRAPEGLPNLPLYPGAQHIIETEKTSQGEDGPTSRTVTFLTSAKPTDVKQYYVTILQKDGWSYNDCHQFHKSIRSGLGSKTLVADVYAESLKAGQSYVSSSVRFGHFSCDKVEGVR